MNAAPSISRHYTNVEVSTTQVKVDAMAQQRQQLKRRSHELLANVDELGQSFSSVDSATVAIDEATLSAGDGGVSTEAYTAFSMVRDLL